MQFLISIQPKCNVDLTWVWLNSTNQKKNTKRKNGIDTIVRSKPLTYDPIRAVHNPQPRTSNLFKLIGYTISRLIHIH